MKILFITNVPSPYRVDFFNELGKYCDLTVTFEKKTSDERDKSWLQYNFKNFTGVFLKGYSINTDTAICFGLKKLIKNNKFDKIICANISSPTTIFFIKYLQRKKIPYIIESDGGFIKSKKGFKYRLKRCLISKANICLSTNILNDEYFLAYGAKKDNILRYPFTSLFKKDILDGVPNVKEKTKIKEELLIKENKLVLAVGQFIHRKGFDILLKCCPFLPEDVGVCFVGGAVTDEYKKLIKDLKLSNVYFVEFKDKETLKKYYQAADLFVLPTREDIWGLVINEAMANGLPIITTNRCGAGIELVKEENGQIISANEGYLELLKAINLCFKEDLLKMGQNSLNIISDYTFEKMVERHLYILKNF